MLFELITAFIIIILFLLWGYYIQVEKKRNVFFKKFPSPPKIPILGNILDLKSTLDVLPVFHRYTYLYGNIITIQIGPFEKRLLVSDYGFLEFLLSSNKLIDKSTDYRFLYPWLGNGLLTSTGSKWKKHRKMITPTFHFKIIEEFVDTFESVGKIMIEKLKNETNFKSVNIYSYITLCALDIICETAMGTKVNAQNDEESEYVKGVKNMCRIIVDRSISFLKIYDFSFQFSKDYGVMKKSLKILHGYTEKVIKEKQNKLKETSTNNSDIENDNVLPKKRKAFLDLLLESKDEKGETLSFTNIREEVDTFMFEGHDTTATSISFTVYCLANNTDVQKKAYEEQLNIFGNEKNPKVTYTDLQNMKYLELVIKESLRIYPSVPIFGREINEDVEYNGILIPKGINLMIFTRGIHMDAKYFPDPEKFDPSRFENIETNKRLPYAYIPFSAGPRNCIGQKFAMLEMKSMVSKILRNFELLPAVPKHDIILLSETVLKSANGVKVGLKIRQ